MSWIGSKALLWSPSKGTQSESRKRFIHSPNIHYQSHQTFLNSEISYNFMIISQSYFWNTYSWESERMVFRMGNDSIQSRQNFPRWLLNLSIEFSRVFLCANYTDFNVQYIDMLLCYWLLAVSVTVCKKDSVY